MENDGKVNGDNNKKDLDDYYFKVWKSYEDVAMHFNDLIIRIRIQSLAGIAALATILGIILKSNIGQDGAFNYGLAIIAIICLMFFWIAIWILDLRYYNRLLEGSVNAILELERNKEGFLKSKHINLSSNIERAFKVKFEHESGREVEIQRQETRKPFINGRKWFYVIVFSSLVFLLICTVFCKCQQLCNQRETSYETNQKVSELISE